MEYEEGATCSLLQYIGSLIFKDKLIDPPSAIVSGDIPNKKETHYWVFLFSHPN